MGGGIVLIAGAVLLYFLPSILGRNKRNAGAILALNLLLGWTIAGWIVALIWALTVDAPTPAVIMTPGVPAPLMWMCPNCKADLHRGDQFCRSCGTRVNSPN